MHKHLLKANLVSCNGESGLSYLQGSCNVHTHWRQLSASAIQTLSLQGLIVTSVTRCGTHKLPKKFSIIETYWHDHSLESSWSCQYFEDNLKFLWQFLCQCLATEVTISPYCCTIIVHWHVHVFRIYVGHQKYEISWGRNYFNGILYNRWLFAWCIVVHVHDILLSFLFPSVHELSLGPV
jgi:hypothetical protein